MPNFSREYAYEQLLKHESLIRAASCTNESTTRMRAIDTMLFDVLGWEKQDIETERHVRAEGYADYAFFDNKAISLGPV